MGLDRTLSVAKSEIFFPRLITYSHEIRIRLITDFSSNYCAFTIMTPDPQLATRYYGRVCTMIVQVIFSAALHSSTVHTGCSCIVLEGNGKQFTRTVRTSHWWADRISYRGMPSGKCVPNEVHDRTGGRGEYWNVYVTVLQMTLDTSPHHGHKSLSRTWCAVHLILIKEGTKMCPPTRKLLRAHSRS